MKDTTLNESVNGNEPMITSPAIDLFNNSSSSGEEFAVDPSTLSELENRFRVAPFLLTDMPTAFMGAAEAMLFSNNGEVETNGEQHIDTRGSIIENDSSSIMDNSSNISSLTFIGSSDDGDLFFGASFADVEQADRNSRGRRVQKKSFPYHQDASGYKACHEYPYYIQQ